MKGLGLPVRVGVRVRVRVPVRARVRVRVRPLVIKQATKQIANTISLLSLRVLVSGWFS